MLYILPVNRAFREDQQLWQLQKTLNPLVNSSNLRGWFHYSRITRDKVEKPEALLVVISQGLKTVSKFDPRYPFHLPKSIPECITGLSANFLYKTQRNESFFFLKTYYRNKSSLMVHKRHH